MKLSFTVATLFLTSQLFAQAPAEEWQIALGGDMTEKYSDLVVCSDGGFLIAGWSESDISGDKTESSRGGRDYWVVKVNASGVVQWDKTIGGSSDDILESAIQTTDGGYTLFGFSESNISGDKTENSLGGTDYWIVKLDATGNIEWQNTIGGNGSDLGQAIEQTSDGGYIIAGYSSSNISGDKTENSNGSFDIWVLKLNSSGSIVWQNTIGGSGSESLSEIRQTSDGGYITASSSSSNISGDKTENSLGGSDCWILKLDASGNITWQNTIGGNGTDHARDVLETSGGYVVLSKSDTDVDSDKTDPSNGSDDYWVFKLDGSGQTILWQNSIGGSVDESANNISETADGHFILSGSSDSGISGDKTEALRDSEDIWGVKVTSTGQIVWDKTLGSKFGNDEPANIYPTNDNGYVFVSDGWWEIAFDKTVEGYETSYDYWVIKLESETLEIEQFVNSSISIYPNPAQDQITIDFKNVHSLVSLKLMDLNGRTVFTESFEQTESIQLELPFQTGIYFLSLETETGLSVTKKIIKK